MLTFALAYVTLSALVAAYGYARTVDRRASRLLVLGSAAVLVLFGPFAGIVRFVKRAL